MKKKYLHITRSVMKISLPIILVTSMVGCSKSESSTPSPEAKESVIEVTPEDENSTSVEEPVEEEQADLPERQETYTSENQVLAYFEELDQKIMNYCTKENFQEIKDGVKDQIFRDMVFCVEFYRGHQDIGGYYIQNLTDPVKNKCTIIIDHLDQMVSSYYPDYKEDLQQVTDITHQGFRSLIDRGTQKIKETLGEDTYNMLMDKTTSIKDSFKNKVKNWGQSIGEWYEMNKKKYMK